MHQLHRIVIIIIILLLLHVEIPQDRFELLIFSDYKEKITLFDWNWSIVIIALLKWTILLENEFR